MVRCHTKLLMIRQIPINGFDNNFSYFIRSLEKHEGGLREGKEIAVVDPGDVPHLVAEIEEEGLVPKMILLTHSHFDHVDGVTEMVRKYGIPVYMHKNARGKVETEEDMTVFLDDGDEVKLGELTVEVMYTPGHIDDAVCYYINAKQDVEHGAGGLITGDTMFVEGCGRADLEGANVDDLWSSLQKIAKLPNKVRIYPGHDYGSKPVSDVAWEKKHNGYLRCKSVDEFRNMRLPAMWG